MITLQPITRDNFHLVIDLKVGDGQETFVAPNLYSIAEAQVSPGFVPLAIYEDETLVGFLMYGPDPDAPGDYWIIRLMIDQDHQGRGYGRAAMQQAIGRIKAEPEVRRILTSYVPDNAGAARLYASLGFADTGLIEEGEVVVLLREEP